MALKAKNSRDIDKNIKITIENINKTLLRELSYIGEEVAKIARKQGNYTDRTANLRSSIGYVIAIDGNAYRYGGFVPLGQQTNGTIAGRKYAEELIKKYNKGIVLITVAGKEYAAAVYDRGYDVLTSATINLKVLIEQLSRDLKLRYDKHVRENK